jgi:hypothetical protein
MTRMNLDQLANYLRQLGLKATADYFLSCKNDSVTVDGWIEEDFVKRHLEGLNGIKLWKELQSNVVSHISLDSIEEKIQWQYMNGDFED